jgi:hypothetical protein
VLTLCAAQTAFYQVPGLRLSQHMQRKPAKKILNERLSCGLNGLMSGLGGFLIV